MHGVRSGQLTEEQKNRWLGQEEESTAEDEQHDNLPARDAAGV